MDFEVLRRAVEQRYAELLVSFYAEDAVVRIVNRKAPPSSPFELHGKAEIAQHLRIVASRDMTHRVENEVIGAERVAFNVACRFPDGNGLLAAATLEVRDGKIVLGKRMFRPGTSRATNQRGGQVMTTAAWQEN